MIISKKSLGKILAVSMASAMAMSSLSAALVTVSAVSDPALSSSGTLELKSGAINAEEVTDPLGRSVKGVTSVEKKLQVKIGADKDNHIDSIQGGVLKFADIARVLTADNLEYTDANGAKAKPECVTVKKYSYSLTGSGATKVMSADGKEWIGIMGSDKNASATLTVTVEADVKLDKNKTKTFKTKYVLDIDNHKRGDVALVMANGIEREGDRTGQKGSQDNVKDLGKDSNDRWTRNWNPAAGSETKNVAAYGGDVWFVLVRYNKTQKVDEGKVGDDADAKEWESSNQNNDYVPLMADSRRVTLGGNGIEGEAERARFYASSSSGADLFELAEHKKQHSTMPSGAVWAAGTRNGDTGAEVTGGGGYESNEATGFGGIRLKTVGRTGTATIRVAYTHKQGESLVTDEYEREVKVVKAVDLGSGDKTIEKSGSKTCVKDDTGAGSITNGANISGFEIRSENGTITVNDGTVGAVKAQHVTIDGGRAGIIDCDEKGSPTVRLTNGATAGDILNASEVTIEEGSKAARITDGTVTLTEGTIDEIDTDGEIEIKGGTVRGDVRSSKAITITSDGTDENDSPLDVSIGGDVVGGQDSGVVVIDNQSEDGNASIEIGGNVVAKFIKNDLRNDGTVQIGSGNTSGPITIKGYAEGESIVLGGRGLISLAGVRAANEIEHDDTNGEVISSTLTFDGFNSVVNAVSGFDTVEVQEGTVTVNGAVDAETLKVNSDGQLVASNVTVEGNIEGGGSIVVPAGELSVGGKVEDSPSLTLLGAVEADALAFAGNRGLVSAFDADGLTFKAARQSDGSYNYLVDKVELGGLAPVGKDVTMGVGQTKTISVAMYNELPAGASIEWTVDDEDIAKITGDGLSATVTGKEIDETTVTAKIVDANGRSLGYPEAEFAVAVLGVDTIESIGSNVVETPINEANLDTTKKNLQVGQTYRFLIRGNNDVNDINMDFDSSVANVTLIDGADSRGALYEIEAVAEGKTNITVTYQGKTSKLAVKVGGFQLDTSSKKMAPGQVYSFLAKNVPADQAGSVTLAYDANVVDVVKVNDNYNNRGVLYQVTAKTIGEAAVSATYNGETETMNVAVVEDTGKLTLDTRSYTMPIGGSYTIGVKVERNGVALTPAQVRAMIASGDLRVTDSKYGSVLTHQVLDNGNIRVSGTREGSSYIVVDVMRGGQSVTHASTNVIVQAGATARGDAARSVSVW